MPDIQTRIICFSNMLYIFTLYGIATVIGAKIESADLVQILTKSVSVHFSRIQLGKGISVSFSLWYVEK